MLLGSDSAFAANNGSSTQTGLASGSPSTLTLATEVYDINSHFTSNAWTPNAGIVWLSGQVYVSGTITTTVGAVSISILKNGTPIATWSNFPSPTARGATVSIIDRASGSDVYSLSVTPIVTSGTGTANGQGIAGVTTVAFQAALIAAFVGGSPCARFNMPMLGI